MSSALSCTCGIRESLLHNIDIENKMPLSEADLTDILQQLERTGDGGAFLATPSVLRDHNGAMTKEGILRRAWILERIQHLPRRVNVDNTYNINFWKNVLTKDERNDADVMYELLGYAPRHEIFGVANPWDNVRQPSIRMPKRFENDHKAYLAYFSSCPESNTSFFENYKQPIVPWQFCDNIEVMEEVCDRLPCYFSCASERLKDNEELVKIAAFADKNYLMRAVKRASGRLREDFEFVSDLLIIFCRQYHFEQRRDHWRWLKYVLKGSSNAGNLKYLMDMVPSPDVPFAIRYVPGLLAGDPETALRLMSKVNPKDAGEILRLCAKHGQDHEGILPAAERRMGYKCHEYSSYCDYASDYDVMTKLSIIASISDKKLLSVPIGWRRDCDVLRAAVEQGIFHDKTSIERYLGDMGAHYNSDDALRSLYSVLPNHLQLDETIAISFIQHQSCSYDLGCDILRDSALMHSKEALMEVLGKKRRDDPGYEPDKILLKCPPEFIDDKDFMTVATRGNSNNMKLVSERLFADTAFMLTLACLPNSSCSSFHSGFLLNDLDTIEEALDNIDGSQCLLPDAFILITSPEVWSSRSFVLKLLSACERTRRDRYHYLPLGQLTEMDPESPFLGDREVITLAVRYHPSEFAFASDELKGDKEFVLKLVREYNRVLHYAERLLWLDEEIIVAALARDPATLVNCFDILSSSSDLKFLLKLSLEIRSKLNLRDAFVRGFLPGMLAKNCGKPCNLIRQCHLTCLNRGLETSIEFKRAIAEYLGVPVGRKYIEFKKASLALGCFGL